MLKTMANIQLDMFYFKESHTILMERVEKLLAKFSEILHRGGFHDFDQKP